MNPLNAIVAPFKGLGGEFEKLVAAVKTEVEIALVLEATKFNLSRLLTLDTNEANQAKYKAALEVL